MNGEAFAYFRWHCMRYPRTPPFSKPREWRLILWELGLRSCFDNYIDVNEHRCTRPTLERK